MKIFSDKDGFFALTALCIKSIPLCAESAPAQSGTADPNAVLAAAVCADAFYLSSAAEPLSLEFLRAGGAQRGEPILHVLVVRCHGRTQRGCCERHAACVQGVTDSLRRRGYTLGELGFEEFSKIFHEKLSGDSVWTLKKELLHEPGMHSDYVSLPVVQTMDWQGIYAALDGSDCTFSVQLLPARPSESEQKQLLRHYTECSRAADGDGVTPMRDALAAPARDRWKALAEGMQGAAARVNLVITGSVTGAALTVARVRQALGSAAFVMRDLPVLSGVSVYDFPWQVERITAKLYPLPLESWSAPELACLLKFPTRGDGFVGLPLNPFAEFSPDDLLGAQLSQPGADKIFIGTTPAGQRVWLPLAMFNLHFACFGKSGVGKTVFLKQLIRAFGQKGISVLVLEPIKREYRALPANENTRVFTVESAVAPLRINPFRVPKGVRLGEYRASLISAFKAAFSLPDPLPSLLEKAIGEAYAQYGWVDSARSGEAGVQSFDMLDFIGIFRRIILSSAYSAEVRGNLVSGGSFRLQSLVERCPITFDTVQSTGVDELLSGRVILEMGGLEPEQKALVTALTLIGILAYLKATRPGGSALKNMILLDEAHALLDNGSGQTDEEKALNSAMNKMLENLVQEIRAYGCGIGFADQSPQRIGQTLLDNVENVFSFRLSGAEGGMLATSLRAPDSAAEALSMLGTGHIIFSNHWLLHPIGLLIPRAPAGERPVSDSELARRQSEGSLRQAGEFRPYRECALGGRCAGCAGCKMSIRSDAAKRSLQMFAARRAALCTPQGLAENLVKVPAALAQQSGIHKTDPDFERRCSCTAIHLVRRAKLEAGVTLSDETVRTLLNVVKQNAQKLREVK